MAITSSGILRHKRCWLGVASLCHEPLLGLLVDVLMRAPRHRADSLALRLLHPSQLLPVDTLLFNFLSLLKQISFSLIILMYDASWLHFVEGILRLFFIFVGYFFRKL